MALIEDAKSDGFTPVFVQDSGEGRWTIWQRSRKRLPADVLSASLYTRFRRVKRHTLRGKILSAMRYKFGGTSTPCRWLGEGRDECTAVQHGDAQEDMPAPERQSDPWRPGHHLGPQEI